MEQQQLLVFTDLDGTLLEHDEYSWEAARTALVRLQEDRIPLVPVSSKTLPEMDELQEALGLTTPYVGENGCVIRLPGDGLSISEPGYSEILDYLHRVRAEQRYRFIGFADMTTEEVMCATGLARHDSRNAKQRLASEPILWQDTTERLKQFRQSVAEDGLVSLQGGRFLHVMGQTDKATAMEHVIDWYGKRGSRFFQTVALGDSENDRLMLLTADVPVIIRRKDGSHLSLPERPDAIISDQPGPAGWNQCILKILDNPRGNHGRLLPTQ